MIDNRLKKEKFRNDRMVKGSDKRKIGGEKGKEDSRTGSYNDRNSSTRGKTGNSDGRTGSYNDRNSSTRGKTGNSDGRTGSYNDRNSSTRGKTGSGDGRTGKDSGNNRNSNDWNGKNDDRVGSNRSKSGSPIGRSGSYGERIGSHHSGSGKNGSDSSKSGGDGMMFQKENRRERRFSSQCPVSSKCGGCQLLDMPYEKQLEQKQKYLEKLLKPYCRVAPIIGMENPYHYRNKVHAVFDHDKKGNPVSGIYEASSHRVVPVERCMIEDQKADEIIGTIRGMLKSFKIRTYDEDTGYGLLRHVLVRRGFTTEEIMVVLITASPVFPSKNNFVKALREKHPEITTIIQNVNGRDTSMVLGNKEHVLYGKGYIEDILCGCRFRISSKSFYQVNPVQTEVLYNKAIEAAGLTGKERVIDAYCGIGTIGIVASKHAKEVIGVELNREAVRDALENAKLNEIKNARFFCNDAGKFMVNMAESGEHVDVVFMDPPRSGSTEEFIDSVAKMRPETVIYVSCGPETLARDLEYFQKKGYEAKMGWGVDMFPATDCIEAIIMMKNKTKY